MKFFSCKFLKILILGGLTELRRGLSETFPKEYNISLKESEKRSNSSLFEIKTKRWKRLELLIIAVRNTFFFFLIIPLEIVKLLICSVL